ncbi:hypothetical protein A4D02_28355 [Niastella koreensis]|uniref:DUF6438 domain-containing protein n=2 Tax=Niastella koreensis TaxID=354356 RepID=G8T8L7_NIAKG|nr:DUF6438 domain-containing protein [Niastella koreensis]AEW00189.1 hypothetical protein Niako_3905 [Niastella koreensis GR20-10]OQP49510.1 hypothetical protein A4D02_28355 [Niastella koreensis]
MKHITTLIILLLTSAFAIGNEIDNLKTNEDVQEFLCKVNKYLDDIFHTVNKIPDNSPFGKGKFFKLDLDQNGLTDLVVNGKYLLAVTDNGNGKFHIHSIDKGAFTLFKYTLTDIIKINKTPLLVIKGYPGRLSNRDTTTKDTLVLRPGGFAEYNPAPDKLTIEEINFETSGCYGECPIFELSIKADKSANFNAIEYNDKKGEFKTIIDDSTYLQLIATINYIKLPSLKNKYRVNWTDDQTVTLEIKYNNGQIKKIEDYGAIGTFGLENLYDQLFSLRGTQHWNNNGHGPVLTRPSRPLFVPQYGALQ